MSSDATSPRSNRSHRTAVVFCEGSGGLGAIRALHKHAVPTIAVAFDPWEPALASRLPKRKVCLPAESPGAFENNLRSFLRNLDEERPALIATSDKLCAFMLKHRDELAERFAFSLPEGRLVDQLNDKAEETQLISSLGIPVPRTVAAIPASAQDLEEMISLPMIIKPRSFEYVHHLNRKNLVLRTGADLRAFYESHGDAREFLIAQEVIPGPDDSLWLCSGTFNRRYELVEGLVKRKLRMAPPHFGVASVAISTSNPMVLELTARLGMELRYTGHMAVEFKWDHRDGLFKYIELNPRIPASVALDEASDVPTVWNTYRVALGEEVEPVAPRQNDGVVYLDLLDDFYHRLKDEESAGAISWSYLKWALHKRIGPHFAWNDPLPALLYSWTFLSRPIVRRLQRLRTGGRPKASR